MGRKILLIDDDTDDRTFFCEALEEVAPEVVCHSSIDGRKALAMLNNKEIEIPDLIFLDINMPVLNGWECLSMLKEHELYKSVPVIMYSTSSHAEDVKKARHLGALCFFTKPADFRILKKSLKIVVESLNNNSLLSISLASPMFKAVSE
jgi:DNA-binding response OmpR family regulator